MASSERVRLDDNPAQIAAAADIVAQHITANV